MSIIKIALPITILLSLMGCGADNDNKSTKQKPTVAEQSAEEPEVVEPEVVEPEVVEQTLSIIGHYYDKGLFDKTKSYENAFSNNTTETNVEIHSYIVIEFDAEVDAASITDTTIQVKRLHMEETPFADSDLNNNNSESNETEHNQYKVNTK